MTKNPQFFIALAVVVVLMGLIWSGYQLGYWLYSTDDGNNHGQTKTHNLSPSLSPPSMQSSDNADLNDELSNKDEPTAPPSSLTRQQVTRRLPVDLEREQAKEEVTEPIVDEDDFDIDYYAYDDYRVFANDGSFIRGARSLALHPGYSDWAQNIEINLGDYLEGQLDVYELTSECNATVCIYKGKIDSARAKKMRLLMLKDDLAEFDWWTKGGNRFSSFPVEGQEGQNLFYLVKTKVG